MSLRKTATQETPHATYTNSSGWIWKILKVNAPKKHPMKGYATWMVAAQSEATFGGWDMGDTYASEVLMYGQLESATPEFEAYLQEHGL